MQGSSRTRRALASAAVVTMVLGGAVACGDDDDGAGGAAAGDTTDACASLVEFNTVAAGDEETDTSQPDTAKALAAQIGPLWQRALQAAPESTRADAEVVTAAIDELATGDDTTFIADATYASYTNVVNAAVEPCGFHPQDVSAVDADGKYEFDGLPETLDEGVLAVTLANDGAEPHALIVFRKNDGETRSAEELLALPEEEGSAAGTEAGAIFAVPGTSSAGLLTLTPGDYVYFCPIPIGGGDDGPPHFTAGMYGEFTVS